MRPLPGQHVTQGKFVSREPQSDDDPVTHSTKIGEMPEFFPIVNVTDVYFHFRYSDIGQRIAYSHGSMRISTSVDHDTIRPRRIFLDEIYDTPFLIGLEIGQTGFLSKQIYMVSKTENLRAIR